MMKQIELLEEYIKALEHENEAKNRQRTLLYNQIDKFKQENTNLQSQIHNLTLTQKSLFQQTQNQHLITTLTKNISQLQTQLSQTTNKLLTTDQTLQTTISQQEKDQQRITILEKTIKQNKKQENKLKEEILKLNQENKNIKQENNNINQQLQQYVEIQTQNFQDQNKINQLIENYQKIQQIAKEKQVQNQYLHEENQTLVQQIQQLKQIVQVKDSQLKIIRKSLRKSGTDTQSSVQEDYNQNQYGTSFRALRAQKIEKSQRDTGLTNMDLVRQNNKLIERITQLEKQKNMLYIESYDKNYQANRNSNQHQYNTPSVSPLRNITSRSNMSQNNSASKLRLRIEALKHENQELMFSLKI